MMIATNVMIDGWDTAVQAVQRVGSSRAVRNLRALSGKDFARNTTTSTCTPRSTQRNSPAGVRVPRSGRSATNARLIGSRNVIAWK
ncbi:MAG: hypothetical protein AUH41_08000 [Gemmatimonadetes bacterium 13_1_40CM_66_11]|nr:MAG: hypothetical protein AUH41_08000 [Gemmatimonadetes bacterium 13_1_40CM_66_11]